MANLPIDDEQFDMTRTIFVFDRYDLYLRAGHYVGILLGKGFQLYGTGSGDDLVALSQHKCIPGFVCSERIAIGFEDEYLTAGDRGCN